MELECVINILVNKFQPYSIFLYGSKATNTDNVFSDYEIGVIFDNGKYVSREDIKKVIVDDKYSIFPFKLNDIIEGTIDTPFQREIYLNVLVNGGSKTLYGVPVLENLVAPQITKDNLIADVNFHLGIALSAVRVYKTSNYELANDLMCKACLYATRDYIYYQFKKLYITYKEIYDFAIELKELNEFKELLQIAYELRFKRNNKIHEKYYYKNISYINKFLLMELM